MPNKPVGPIASHRVLRGTFCTDRPLTDWFVDINTLDDGLCGLK